MKMPFKTMTPIAAKPHPSLEHLDPELLTKTTTTLYQIQFRLRMEFVKPKGYAWDWVDIPHELWKPADWANERLKYWQGLSLSRVLEFRVQKVERELK